MYNQLFLHSESERRAQRLLREAGADRFARVGKLLRASGGGLGKDYLGAFEALLSRRRHGVDSARNPALKGAEGDALAEVGAHARSGAAVAEDCCDLVAP